MDTLTPPSSPYSKPSQAASAPASVVVQPEHAKHLLMWIVLACVFVSIIVLGYLAFSIRRIQNNQSQNLVREPALRTESLAQVEESSSLGADIYEKSSNPAQNAVPESNPFASTETNPFQSGYTNPFQ